MIKISVIIPVYKVGPFLKKGVESVLIQPEVDEILLIEDGSPDNSWELCCELKNEYPDKIKLFHHANRSNLGAAVTRNVGIENAKNDFLAFLDADDFYLPGRFSKVREIFEKEENVDGVYEAIGTHYYDEAGKELHHRRMKEINIEGLGNDLTTLTREIEPEKLFEELLVGHCGWFHFNGLTIRKSVIKKTGLLDTFMRYGQDTDFFYRLALNSRLMPGNIKEPVGMRGVYGQNSTLNVFLSKERADKNNFYNAYMWKKLFLLAKNAHFSKEVNRYLFFRYVDHYDKTILNMPIDLKRKIYKTLICLGVLLEHPGFIFKIW